MDLAAPLPSIDLDWSARLAQALDVVRAEAADRDRDGRFASASLDALRQAGVLAAPLPVAEGGLGAGTSPDGVAAAVSLLRGVGHASLAMGRVFEGHLNALRLVLLYGTRAQAARMAEDVRAGHLFAIWAAEAPRTRVRLDGDVLRGRKSVASGAPGVTRALLTVERPGEGEVLMIVKRAAGAGVCDPLDLHGVRAAGTAPVDFEGAAAGEIVGRAGDYMRQPEISLGAWRPLAVMLGGLDALVDAYRAELVSRGRDADAVQRARAGDVFVAHGTAALWVDRAAALAEADSAGEMAATTVKLARVAFEGACATILRLVQKALGIGAFVRPHPVERLSRDLSVYLRQPAIDMVLDEAAEQLLRRGAP